MPPDQLRQSRGADFSPLTNWPQVALYADRMSALPAINVRLSLLGYIVFRLGSAHQPPIEPADDVLEAFDAMPRLA
jgi:hypothetical protein